MFAVDEEALVRVEFQCADAERSFVGVHHRAILDTVVTAT